MFLVSLATLHSASKHGAARPYLALLKPGIRNSIDRKFAKMHRRTNNCRVFALYGQPGDIFEARRWLWDDIRQQYCGGTVWFGICGNGELVALTRDEAFYNVLSVKIPHENNIENSPIKSGYAKRFTPNDISCAPAQIENKDVLCLPSN